MDAAVTETDAVLIFFFGVLCVMDQQVSAFRKPVAGGPGFVVWERLSSQSWFMVRKIGYDCVCRLNAVANRGVGMNDQLRMDPKFPNFDHMSRQFVEVKFRSQFTYADWK